MQMLGKVVTSASMSGMPCPERWDLFLAAFLESMIATLLLWGCLARIRFWAGILRRFVKLARFLLVFVRSFWVSWVALIEPNALVVENA